MPISNELKERNSDLCELCNAEPAAHEYTVSPKNDDSIVNQVALCSVCLGSIDKKDAGFYWRCLEGSIWNPEPGVQALSYRILHQYKEEDWANNLINSVDLDENVINWAMSAFETPDVHMDAFGNKLENGDTIVLTEQLNVKGTSFTASKGTVVKKIKLVHDNHEQIEGKINDQTIVILTKFVKKSL
jgi:protein PhnA